MKTRLIGAFVALLAALLVGSTETPAEAATGSLSSANGVLYSSCRNHAYHYSVPSGVLSALAADPEYSSWDLDVTLYGPDGQESGGDYLYGDATSGDPTSGNSTVQICGGLDIPGRYTISAIAEWSYWDASDNYIEGSSSLPAAHFTMRRTQSRTAVRVSDRTPRRNQVIRITSMTTDERPAGFFRSQYATVRLQHRVGGVWRSYRRAGFKAMTNSRGVHTWRVVLTDRRATIRVATVAQDSGYAGSHSRAVTIRRH